MEELAKSLAFDPKIFLFQLVLFLGLWAFMTLLFWKPMMAHLQARHDSIEAAHHQVETARTEMENLRNDYQTRIGQIEVDARSRIQNAIKEAQAERERLIAESRAQSAQTLQEGVAALEREKTEAIVNLQPQVLAFALDISQKALGAASNEAALRTLIENRLKNSDVSLQN